MYVLLDFVHFYFNIYLYLIVYCNFSVQAFFKRKLIFYILFLEILIYIVSNLISQINLSIGYNSRSLIFQ